MKHTASENIWKNVVLIFIGAGIALSSASAAAQKAAAGVKHKGFCILRYRSRNN